MRWCVALLFAIQGLTLLWLFQVAIQAGAAIRILVQ